jgi:hypothetical protein
MTLFQRRLNQSLTVIEGARGDFWQSGEEF